MCQNQNHAREDPPGSIVYDSMGFDPMVLIIIFMSEFVVVIPLSYHCIYTKLIIILG